jgi:hypothetical protein
MSEMRMCDLGSMMPCISAQGDSLGFGRHEESESDKDYLSGFHPGDITVVPPTC